MAWVCVSILIVLSRGCKFPDWRPCRARNRRGGIFVSRRPSQVHPHPHALPEFLSSLVLYHLSRNELDTGCGV